MIGTLQALLVAVFAVLPGALYTLARENFGATWAWRQTDTATQIFRFLSASALFHAIFAPLTYIAYQTLVVTDALAYGDRISWWWWAAIGGVCQRPLPLGLHDGVVARLERILTAPSETAKARRQGAA